MQHSAKLLKDFIVQKIIINEACVELFKEVIEKASFKGLGKVALLAESPLKEWKMSCSLLCRRVEGNSVKRKQRRIHLGTASTNPSGAGHQEDSNEPWSI